MGALTCSIMSKLFLICVLACVAMAAAKPRVLPLRKAVPHSTECGTTQLIACSGGIEGAWNDCYNNADIFGCINDVLGASDCIVVCAMSYPGWAFIPAEHKLNT